MNENYSDNTLLDNSTELFTVANAIKEWILNPKVTEIKIATAYWDLPAVALIYRELLEFLNRKNSKIQLLIGTDPIVRKYQLKEPIISSEEYIKRHISELKVTNEYEKVVALLLEFCTQEEDSKIDIKILRKNINGEQAFLHAKTYIFLGENLATGIIGSSNFTKKGLTDNTELNYLETNKSIVTAEPNINSYSMGHKYWFNEKWSQAEDWKKYFLEEVLKPSPIGQTVINAQKEKREEVSELTPYELYIKLLQEKFGDLVDRETQNLIESYLPKKYKPLSYQLDAVSQCYSIMKEHGGFLLSDVVGLGKTIVGTLIIRHFLNIEDNEEREKSILIVTPPAIKSSWIATIKDFDKDSVNKIYPCIDFITTGSINNLVDDIDDDSFEEYSELENQFSFENNHKDYGLILIDESHKFRNNSTSMYKALDEIISDIGTKSGNYPYIGLLSATPQNNKPNDLRNQIYLFERDRKNSTLKKADGGNIERFFSRINEQYQSIIKKSQDDDERNQLEKINELKRLSLEIRDCVLQDILVRRTRTDVIKYYNEDIESQHIKFPRISGPHELEYKLSPELATLFSTTMDFICPKIDFNFDEPKSICYYRYRAFAYLLDENNREKYGANNRDAKEIALQLAKIMQINLVKRLESSFLAFKESLKNLKQYTKNMIDMWEHDSIFICPDINVNAEFNAYLEDKSHLRFTPFENIANSLREKIKRLTAAGKNDNESNKEYHVSDFDKTYIEKLRTDYQIIDWLYSEWSSYDNDPKLEKFKKCLREELLGKDKNNKLVIFTEAIDTVNSLKRAIVSEFSDVNVLYITAANRDEKEQIIKENFDANYDGEWKDDYQIIITTEVLAEGINLHRANTILNYDTPWNATRLMQRIGRVNRIGSLSDEIYVYNFMPSSEGDKQIDLVKKALVKLQSFHTIFGEDNKIFSNNESVVHYDLTKHINGEESPIEKYLHELKEFKKSNEERYNFIQKQTKGLEISINKNSSHGYFLVKVKDSSPQYIESDINLNTRILTAEEMFSLFKPGKEDTNEKQFPSNWSEMKNAAETKVMQSLLWKKTLRKKSKKVTEAKGYIQELSREKLFKLSTNAKNILATIFKILSNKGNIDIASKVIKFYAFVKDQNNYSIAKLSESEFNEIVERRFGEVANKFKKDELEATVFIGLSK